MKKRSDGRFAKKVTLPNGEIKFFYGKTEREVYKKIDEYILQKSKPRTFNEVADQWQREHWENIEDGTITCYRPALARAIEKFGNIEVNDIKPLDVQRALNEMKVLNYSHHTTAIYLSVLRQILNVAVLNSDIDVNPSIAVKVPKGLKTKKREIPNDEIIKAVDNGMDKDFGLFAYLIMYTGLRRGEALAIQLKDIFLKKQIINIYKSLSFNGSATKIKTTKTEAGQREVFILNRLIPMLSAIDGKPTDYLFGGEKPLSESVYRRKWLKYCKAIGMIDKNNKPLFTPHQLRHVYATFLYEQEIGIKDAQKLLGHTKAETTQDTYQHIRMSRLPQVADKLNNIKVNNP